MSYLIKNIALLLVVLCFIIASCSDKEKKEFSPPLSTSNQSAKRINYAVEWENIVKQEKELDQFYFVRSIKETDEKESFGAKNNYEYYHEDFRKINYYDSLKIASDKLIDSNSTIIRIVVEPEWSPWNFYQYDTNAAKFQLKNKLFIQAEICFVIFKKVSGSYCIYYDKSSKTIRTLRNDSLRLLSYALTSFGKAFNKCLDYNYGNLTVKISYWSKTLVFNTNLYCFWNYKIKKFKRKCKDIDEFDNEKEDQILATLNYLHKLGVFAEHYGSPYLK